MRLGAISDIHGNLPAFEAVLNDMPTVEHVVCAGDVVGYNPWPQACVDLVRERGIPCVSGNHDRAVARATGFRFNQMAQAGVEYASEELAEGALEWLRTLPTTTTRLDGQVRIVHGHPDDPDRYTYPSEFSTSMLSGESLLVLGHTHIQHAETFEAGIVLNPGSVGQPRDGDPRAAYAVVDLTAGEVDLRRVKYDIERVQRKVSEVGLPRQLGDRLEEGR